MAGFILRITWRLLVPLAPIFWLTLLLTLTLPMETSRLMVLAAPNPTPTPKPAWQTKWETTLAAAKREGVLVANGPPGDPLRKALKEFQKAYPDIKLKLTGMGGRNFAPRILSERGAGKYLWDIHVGGSGTPARHLRPKGVLKKIKPALILPEVIDDRKWRGGFDAGFYDKRKDSVYAFEASLAFPVWVNQDYVPKSQLSQIKDLLDPKWKGKIVWDNPLRFGVGIGYCGHLLRVLGDDFIRRLFAQDIAISTDHRQLIEMLVSGRRPIAGGVREEILGLFQAEGLGLNVKPLSPDTEEGVYLAQFSGGVILINQAPHPNSAKVFLNWLLSKKGQTAWTTHAGTNSRRLDVTVGRDPRPKPNVRYHGDVAMEKNLPLAVQCVRIAKEVIR